MCKSRAASHAIPDNRRLVTGGRPRGAASKGSPGVFVVYTVVGRGCEAIYTACRLRCVGPRASRKTEASRAPLNLYNRAGDAGVVPEADTMPSAALGDSRVAMSHDAIRLGYPLVLRPLSGCP
jgi:hypothetical protein